MEKNEINRRIREWWDYAVSANTEEERIKGESMFKQLSSELTFEERRIAGELHREYLHERMKKNKN